MAFERLSFSIPNYDISNRAAFILALKTFLLNTGVFEASSNDSESLIVKHTASGRFIRFYCYNYYNDSCPFIMYVRNLANTADLFEAGSMNGGHCPSTNVISLMYSENMFSAHLGTSFMLFSKNEDDEWCFTAGSNFNLTSYLATEDLAKGPIHIQKYGYLMSEDSGMILVPALIFDSSSVKYTKIIKGIYGCSNCGATGFYSIAGSTEKAWVYYQDSVGSLCIIPGIND